MPFVFSKISNHGSSNRVIARLQLQTAELLDAVGFPREQRDNIFNAMFTASMRLVRCDEIVDRLRTERDKAMADHKPGGLPHVINLQNEAETFLYEAKNFLRDLAAVLNAAFGSQFNEARSFCPSKKEVDSDAAQWAHEAFGEGNRFTEFFRMHYKWLGELIAMRNAVEHPDGYSGRLHIHNFELMSDGTIRLPVWHRNDNAPSKLIEDMEGIADYLLQFAEELVALTVETQLDKKFMQIVEIPARQRDPKCPVRFRVTISEEILKKLPPAPGGKVKH